MIMLSNNLKKYHPFRKGLQWINYKMLILNEIQQFKPPTNLGLLKRIWPSFPEGMLILSKIRQQT